MPKGLKATCSSLLRYVADVPSAVVMTGEHENAASCCLAALGSSPGFGISDDALNYGAIFNKVSLKA